MDRDGRPQHTAAPEYAHQLKSSRRRGPKAPGKPEEGRALAIKKGEANQSRTEAQQKRSAGPATEGGPGRSKGHGARRCRCMVKRAPQARQAFPHHKGADPPGGEGKSKQGKESKKKPRKLSVKKHKRETGGGKGQKNTGQGRKRPPRSANQASQSAGWAEAKTKARAAFRAERHEGAGQRDAGQVWQTKRREPIRQRRDAKGGRPGGSQAGAGPGAVKS